MNMSKQQRISAVAIAVCACACVFAAQPAAPAPADQSRRELMGLMVQYRTTLRTTRAVDAAKQQAEKIMNEAMPLFLDGRTGELRRRMSQGMALMHGLPWTPREEYAASLVLRTNMTIFDPSRPLLAELGQVYPCDYKYKAEPVVRLSLKRGNAVVRQLGTFSDVPRDLIDEPLALDADVHGLADGQYLLRAELLDGDAVIGGVVTEVQAVENFETRRAETERRLAAIAGHDDVKLSIRYPYDLARLVNSGRRDLSRGMNFTAEMNRSRELLDALAAGKDPLAGAKGDLKRHYYLKEAGEILPYRLYIPSSYDGKRQFPLIVALHGLGGNEDTMLGRDDGLMKTLAEKHGYIVACPLGYRPNGGYGRSREGVFAFPGLKRLTELSEQDVMHVLALVREQYRIDPRRIYLTGHSMGGGGTWTLGVKYAETWAALAPIAGAASENLDFKRVADKPVLICHGDKDPTVPPEAGREAAAKLRQAGGKPVHLEIPGANHGTIVAIVMPKIFEFFDQHQ